DTDGRGIVVAVVVFLGFVAALADPPTAAALVARARPSPMAASLERDADRTIFDPALVKANKFCSFVLCECLAPPPKPRAAKQFRLHDEPLGSLAAKRVDRRQSGGTGCRIHAEDQPDGDGHDPGADGRQWRDGDRVALQVRQDHGSEETD